MTFGCHTHSYPIWGTVCECVCHPLIAKRTQSHFCLSFFNFSFNMQGGSGHSGRHRPTKTFPACRDMDWGRSIHVAASVRSWHQPQKCRESKTFRRSYSCVCVRAKDSDSKEFRFLISHFSRGARVRKSGRMEASANKDPPCTRPFP